MNAVLLLALLAAPPVPDAEAKPWHRAVGLLQYLEGDYVAAVETNDPAELEEQRSFAREAVVAIDSLGPRGAEFSPRARALAETIEKGGGNPQQIAGDAGQLARDLIVASGLSRAPRRTPDLARGEEVYRANCQLCHGPRGDGEMPVGKALKPPAASFLDRKSTRLNSSH